MGKSFKSYAQKFPLPRLHMIAFDLSFTYVMVLVKAITDIFYWNATTVSKHLSPTQHCSHVKTSTLYWAELI